MNLLIKHANGRETKHSLKLENVITAPHTLVTRHWAQTELQQIEITSGQPTQIIAHCKKYGLVSDHTSLIVLERFQDYVTYNIPPPEPALLETWRTARNARTTRPQQHTRNRFTSAWHNQLAWMHRNFSWLPLQISAHYHQNSIWLKAVASVFKPGEIDPRPQEKIRDWQTRAAKIIQAQHGVKSPDALKQWIQQNNQLTDEWIKLKNLLPKRPAGKPLAVSIRGLVMHPRTYLTHRPLSLRQSIAHAGGLNHGGSPMNISLYRNAHATTYNIASKAFRDFPLLAGDMVVAGPEPYDEHSWDDPFGDASGGDSATPDPSEKPAITPLTPKVTAEDIRASGGGGDDSFGGGPRQSNRQPPVKLVSKRRENPPAPKESDWEIFHRMCKEPAQASAAYYKLLVRHPRPAAFYLRAATILSASGNKKLANQVLSNISEQHGNDDLPALRRRSYYLTQLNHHGEAAQLLKHLIRLHGKTTADLLLLAHNQHRAGQKSQCAATIQNMGKNAARHDHAMDLVIAHIHAMAFKLPDRLSRNRPPADLLCTLLSSNPAARLGFSADEPLGHTTFHYRPSSQGGRFHSGSTLTAYSIKKGLPGKYRINCTSSQSTTIHAILYKDWGTNKQTVSHHTIEAVPGRPTLVAEATIEFK